MKLRITVSLMLLFSVFFLPFYVSTILALGGIIYFRIYFEGVLLMLLIDLLHGVREARFLRLYFVFFLSSLLIMVIIEFIKTKMRT